VRRFIRLLPPAAKCYHHEGAFSEGDNGFASRLVKEKTAKLL
jgi:hypothetical protein